MILGMLGLRFTDHQLGQIGEIEQKMKNGSSGSGIPKTAGEIKAKSTWRH